MPSVKSPSPSIVHNFVIVVKFCYNIMETSKPAIVQISNREYHKITSNLHIVYKK